MPFDSITRTAVLVATVALAVDIAMPLHAQESASANLDERLLECDAITQPTARLACFNTIVEKLGQATEATEATKATKATGATAMPAETRVEMPASVPEKPPLVAGDDTTPAREPVAARPPTAAVPAPAAGKTVSQESQRAPVTDTTPDQARTIRATIVDVWPTIDGRFEVRLDNGQVWRETERTRVRTPAAGSPVLISPGRFGSYMMKVGKDNRRAGVRRTE